ncbi:MAG: response regulator transcription factor [Azonexus sp.]|jgi:DNA-binding NarL/FixJ family response regulator
MQHWIVDKEAVALSSWQEAIPRAVILRRDQVLSGFSETPGVYWCRLRIGEALDDVMPPKVLRAGQLVVVLADEPDESVVSDALAAGASGCCNTYAAPEVLRQVMLVVENGGLWIGQSLLQKLVGSTSRLFSQRSSGQNTESCLSLLSEREAQVARLVAGGASNKEIAEQLFITERTVKAHLSAVFEKLGLRDRLQLSLKINGLSI